VGVTITAEHLEAARAAGACVALEHYRAGQDIGDVSAEHLRWFSSKVPDVAVLLQGDGPALQLFGHSCSGEGSGNGSGYGSGRGYGYGDGSSYGSGYAYGLGNGSGSGYGYGPGYGYGYGDGSSYGYDDGNDDDE